MFQHIGTAGRRRQLQRLLLIPSSPTYFDLLLTWLSQNLLSCILSVMWLPHQWNARSSNVRYHSPCLKHPLTSHLNPVTRCWTRICCDMLVFCCSVLLLPMPASLSLLLFFCWSSKLILLVA